MLQAGGQGHLTEVCTDSLTSAVTGEQPRWNLHAGVSVTVPTDLCSVCMTNEFKFLLPKAAERLSDSSHVGVPTLSQF